MGDRDPAHAPRLPHRFRARRRQRADPGHLERPPSGLLGRLRDRARGGHRGEARHERRGDPVGEAAARPRREALPRRGVFKRGPRIRRRARPRLLPGLRLDAQHGLEAAREPDAPDGPRPAHARGAARASERRTRRRAAVDGRRARGPGVRQHGRRPAHLRGHRQARRGAVRRAARHGRVGDGDDARLRARSAWPRAR